MRCFIKRCLLCEVFTGRIFIPRSIDFSITLIGNYTNSLPKLINNIFYVLIIVFIVDRSNELLNVILNPQAIILGFISSNVATESSLSFYFAALSFYFVIEKDKKRAIWAIVFTVLSFKRIACAGFVVALVLYYSSNILNIKYNRKLFSLILSSVNFIYLWSLILLETSVEFRVRYAETDQMGVVYHANYFVWCEIARTELIRNVGATYAELEKQGVLLAVADASMRYQAPARYDDMIRAEAWLEEVRTRTVTFGYNILRVPEDGGEPRAPGDGVHSACGAGDGLPAEKAASRTHASSCRCVVSVCYWVGSLR